MEKIAGEADTTPSENTKSEKSDDSATIDYNFVGLVFSKPQPGPFPFHPFS